MLLEPDAGRAPRSEALADARRARKRDLRVSRDLPQPPPPSLSVGHAYPSRVRDSAQDSDSGLKSRNPTPRNPGQPRVSIEPRAVQGLRLAAAGSQESVMRPNVKCPSCVELGERSQVRQTVTRGAEPSDLF